MMEQFIVMHPTSAIMIAVVPVLCALLLIWRGRLAVRMSAAVAGLAWAIVVTAYLASILAEAGSFLDRKNFVFLPVQSILHDITTTAERGDLDTTRLQLSEFQQNWSTICMTTNDPWSIQERIEAIGNITEANHQIEHTR